MLRLSRAVLITYGVLAVACWPLELLNRLHVESMALLALVSFFAAGQATIGDLRDGRGLLLTGAARLAELALPLALWTVPVLWAPNCGWVQGLLFFLLFPLVTVLFATAVGFAVHDRTAARWIHAVTGAAIVVLAPLWDVGLHPQFYTYNHVFGGVLGPIYDDELAIRTGLFVFRALTLIWSALLVLWAVALRRGDRRFALAGAALLLVVGGLYLKRGEAGINTPYAYLESQLGGVVADSVVVMRYDPQSLSQQEAERLFWRHRWHLQRIEEEVGMRSERPVYSFIYPDPETKARLTGARYTSVSPVWLDLPQVHLLEQAAPFSLDHELAHVVTRAFGGPLNASLHVGLVEGVAVALEAPRAAPPPDDQVLASGRFAPDEIGRRLTPWAFWTGRGAVSYTVMGSFVRHLLAHYDAAALRRAYAEGDLEAAYGRSVEELAATWLDELARQPTIARDAHDVATRRFAVPSLFEERCPHYVPPYRRAYRSARQALRQGETARADELLQASLDLQSDYLPARRLWADRMLERGEAERVVDWADTTGTPLDATAHRLAGEAALQTGDSQRAIHHLDAALERTPSYAAGGELVLLALRRLSSATDSAAIARGVIAYRDDLRERRHEKLLERSPPEKASGEEVMIRMLASRVLPGWRARAAERIGRYERAAEEAERAAAAWSDAGAPQLEAAWEHDARMYRWIADQRRAPAGSSRSVAIRTRISRARAALATAAKAPTVAS